MGVLTKSQAGKEYARTKIKEVFAGSSIADNVPLFPKFEKTECTLGKVLGKGGFGTVYEIKSFKINGEKVKQSNKGFSDDLEETQYDLGNSGDSTRESRARMFIAQHCLRNNSDARYALKILSPEVIGDQGMFIQGMIDMALETRLMSDIEHTNIVKIRAMAKCDPFDANYFLIMDRLYDTLERRIQKVWLPKHKKQHGFLGKAFDRKGEKKDALFEERIVYAYDLSAAINYLHKRKILYRDIKPEVRNVSLGYARRDTIPMCKRVSFLFPWLKSFSSSHLNGKNIGFDCRDDIKLFDFGLAKELHDSLMTKDGLYKLTADTGSPRYMAPGTKDTVSAIHSSRTPFIELFHSIFHIFLPLATSPIS